MAALWGLLAFFGAPNSIPEKVSLSRWQIINRLFVGSVLAVESNESPSLPPSESQLSACWNEMTYLRKLLSKGALMSMPSSDSMVVNLIKKAVMLQSDDYFGNELSRIECLPLIRDEKDDRKMIARLWKATSPLFFMDPGSVRQSTISLFDISFDPRVGGDSAMLQDLFMPTSKILRECCALLPAWIQHIPEKKVRQKRLYSALNSLVESILGLASKSDAQCPTATNQESSNSFESVFAVQPPIKSGTGTQRRSIFLLEATALLKLTTLLSKDSSKCCTEGSEPLNLSVDVVKQVRQVDVLFWFEMKQKLESNLLTFSSFSR